ncbi:MAG: DegT/DnrJ/EryC1/StrS family aminotransferase, partial [Promethearchaeota archaeon]
VALAALSNPETEDYISSGGKIIVPALTWSTSVYPILDIGCVPVFVDSNKKTLNLDNSLIGKAIDNDTHAIVAVHLIGNPCALDELREIADDHNLFLVEDCCEAHGAEFKNKKVGSYGEFGTFSFFFSHHITTIEGGMIVTNDNNLADMCRCLRAHGWTRHLKERERIEKQYPERDPRFLFINRGYNFRPTDLQGAFGNHQLRKLDNFVDVRRRCASVISDKLIQEGAQVGLQMEQPDGKHSWFGFPLILQESSWENRAKVIRSLEKASVETRPIMSGNMADQPAMKLFKHEVREPLSVARRIDVSGLFVGLNQNMTDEEANELANRIIISLNERGV